MQIPCPWCGTRPRSEFSYLGDASVERPEIGEESPAEAWMGYVYLRANPAGAHKELWYHAGGCRSWLVVTRDTLSHEIADVRMADPDR